LYHINRITLSYSAVPCCQVLNTDSKEFDFTTALHSYFGVADASSPEVNVKVRSLQSHCVAPISGHLKTAHNRIIF
jgi:D-hexose-6-phosphate mutarotase